MTVKIGRNEPCPCGSTKKYKKCCIDQPSPAMNVPDTSPVKLFMDESERGMLLREIPIASPLDTTKEKGYAAEDAMHKSAATWGMPDFVYRSGSVVLGSGQRELGDGFLLVGKVGVVLQSKSRDADVKSEEKEMAWLQKKVAEAVRQGNGTIRKMRQSPTTLTNLRNREIIVTGSEYEWINVVVIDHDDLPTGFTPSLDKQQHPTVVIARRDWDFLFNQLKSTTAVVNYFRHIAGEEHELGREFVRYCQIADASEQLIPDSTHTPSVFPNETVVSGSAFPMQPAGLEGFAYHLLFRRVMEDLAISIFDDPEALGATEENRVRVLAGVDSIPVSQRAAIGEFLATRQKAFALDKRQGMNWGFRNVLVNQQRILFGVCSQPLGSEVQNILQGRIALAHYTDMTKPDPSHITTGVLLTPQRNGDFRTTLSAVMGSLDIEKEYLERLKAQWVK